MLICMHVNLLNNSAETNLIGEGVDSAAFAHPCDILLSHQQAQCLADVWVVSEVTPADTHSPIASLIDGFPKAYY